MSLALHKLGVFETTRLIGDTGTRSHHFFSLLISSSSIHDSDAGSSAVRWLIKGCTAVLGQVSSVALHEREAASRSHVEAR